MWYSFKPYVPVAKEAGPGGARDRQAAHHAGDHRGAQDRHTFWGQAWCDNLESYSDFANRLPRGRTYVRNGSVVDLQIGAGKLTALVSGSSLYKLTVTIDRLPAAAWRSIKERCAGQIGSLVELLQGRLSQGVMDVVTARDGGLFPKPREIKMACSCPDWAGLCKHLAAVLYGIGARLDQQPELLFTLRQVDHLELIEEALPQAGKKASSGKKTLRASDVADVFGIDLAEPEATPETPRPPAKGRAARPAKAAAKNAAARRPRTAQKPKLRMAK